MAAVNPAAFAGGRSLPRAREWQQRGRPPICRYRRRPVNPVTLLPRAREWQQQRKAREWIGGRSMLPIAASSARAARQPAAVNGQHCPGQARQGNGGGQSCCCPFRPANSAHCGRRPFFALGKAAYRRPVNPAAALAGRPTLPIAAGGRSLPWARQQDRRRAVNSTFTGGQLCPGQGMGKGSSAKGSNRID